MFQMPSLDGVLAWAHQERDQVQDHSRRRNPDNPPFWIYRQLDYWRGRKDWQIVACHLPQNYQNEFHISIATSCINHNTTDVLKPHNRGTAQLHLQFYINE